MKKLITSIIALIVCATGATAATELDLSGMSLDELIALQQQVQMAMWETDEWQEVEVPIGIYEVGVDIPAGMWVITSTDCLGASYGTEVNEYHTDLEDLIAFESLWNEGESFAWNLVDGTYIQIDYAPAIFTPYTAPSLGFK